MKDTIHKNSSLCICLNGRYYNLDIPVKHQNAIFHLMEN